MAEQVIDTPAPTGLSQLEQLQFDYINLQLQNLNTQTRTLQLEIQQASTNLENQRQDVFKRRVNMIAELEKAHPELTFDQANNLFKPRPVEVPPVADEPTKA